MQKNTKKFAQSFSKEFSYKKTLVVGFGFLGVSILWSIFDYLIHILL